MFAIRRLQYGALLFALALAVSVYAAAFTLPAGEQTVAWQAEEAMAQGWQRIEHPWAAGGAYMECAGAPGEATLEFHFRAPEAMTLRVWPLWWRHGDRRKATRFPYPCVAQPGPDAIVECAGRLFFTAPINGRVGIIDPKTERCVGEIAIGGYLTDILGDPSAGRVYVADALGDRVVVVDAKRAQIIKSISVPAEPWALALYEKRLYVACRQARRIVVVDVAQGRIEKKVRVPAPPIRLEIREGGSRPSAGLLVWFIPYVYEAESGKARAADELQYPIGASRLTLRPDQTTTYSAPSPQIIRLRTASGSTDIDVSSVTRGGPIGALALCHKRLFFTAPEAGKIGVIDVEQKRLLQALDVGGRPTDLVAEPVRERVYATDEAGARVLVLDAKDLTMAKEVPVPEQPRSLELVTTVPLQRPELVAPRSMQKLFVACGRGRALAMIDLDMEQVVRTEQLPGSAALVRLAPVPGYGWWPLMPLERIPIALTPRVAVSLAPVRIALPDLAEQAEEAYVPFSLRDRVTLADGRTFSAERCLLIGVREALKPGAPGAASTTATQPRWIDVTAIADPQLAELQPLTKRDQPGAIALALDNGPEFDWQRDCWMTADTQTYLVGNTAEFWRWNAPYFRVSPGEHKLRVRGYSAQAALDALAVQACLDDQLAIRIRPEPKTIHGAVPLSGYEGVFYDQEPVEFSVEFANMGRGEIKGVWHYTLTNYMNEQVAGGPAKEETIVIKRGQTLRKLLRFTPRETGRFTLEVRVLSSTGTATAIGRFVRLPKLEHPRLFFRKEDLGAIRARIAAHPQLFRRYAQWLVRQLEKDGTRFPELFLPPGLTQAACASAAPPMSKNPGQDYGWRMYELGWRLMACQFMAQYSELPEAKILAEKLRPYLQSDKSDAYCQFHHHGPFFPGAAAALYDMAPEEERRQAKLRQVFAGRMGSMDVYPEMLVAFEEPMTPEKRAMIYKIMQFAFNLDRYFATHHGTRGGLWWLNPWTGCHCPLHGLLLAQIFTRNFFGEERLLEKDYVRDFLTFHRYVDPLADRRRLLPSMNTPLGEPWRWLHMALTRHPLEHANYSFDVWLQKLEGPLPEPEAEAVDRLMALEGMPNVGPLRGGVNHFVTGTVVPIALAWGYYDPQTPKVTKPELPPSAVFDFEGWAVMKSGWDPQKDTEVSFVCGPRDHASRQQPGHFTIVKAGDFLIGTPALFGDDGNCTPSWGNVVVVGEDWLPIWRENLWHPRSPEWLILNRFSPATFTYIARDRERIGFRPAEGGWGGGLDLHGHTETPLWQQGELLAFETRPEIDYAAGDMTNTWPADLVREMYRQIVFLKPDTVVVYDRVQLRKAATTQWLAATAPELKVGTGVFSAGKGEAKIAGRVLLPAEANILSAELPKNFYWKDQQLVAIRLSEPRASVEYLVVLQTGLGAVTPPEARLVQTETHSGVELALEGKTIRLLFQRNGAVGGEIIGSDGTRWALPEKIVDSYAHWRSDPRFTAWMTEPRFEFAIPVADRQTYRRN